MGVVAPNINNNKQKSNNNEEIIIKYSGCMSILA